MPVGRSKCIFVILKFFPMFSALLFLNVTVPSLLVTVLLCEKTEKVDIFTVRPSGPYLSILSVDIIVFWWLIICVSQ